MRANGTAMWKFSPQQLDKQTIRSVLSRDSQAFTYGEVIGLWQNDASFRKFFTAALCECPFDAFFWETPPVTSRTLERPFEFVLVQSAALSGVDPDPAPFATHFSAKPSAEVLTFPNLGGDAILVVPAPLAEKACYPHLATFLRRAPVAQVNTFWQKVGLAMQGRVSDAPTWLSTAGLGVSWLHLRLDSRPKYYRHLPYKTASA